MHTELRYHIINKYRESISKRYDYDRVKDNPDLPKALNRKTANELRKFFLEKLYSEPTEREKLDAAFKQLESFIVHPSKIWGLLGNLPAAILEFGFHFPAAIKAAVSALETHTSARHFEDTLLHTAVSKNFEMPLTDKQFKECLTSIPVDQLQKFIHDLSALFYVISDTELLGKTIHIMQSVLKRMENKPQIYGTDDTDAIELGIDIFQNGHELLGKYDEESKKEIVDFVIAQEAKFIDSLHHKSR